MYPSSAAYDNLAREEGAHERMKSARKTKIALFVAAMLLLTAMAAFFVIGAAETGLDGLAGGNFFAPDNLLAWQIPALRGLDVETWEEEWPEGYFDSNTPSGQLPPTEIIRPEPAAATPAPKASQAPKVEVVEIDPNVSESVKVEILNMDNEKLPAIDLSGAAPRVLIYSTHSTEAYTQTDENKYDPSSEWRTEDETRNIIAVGALLARELQEKYGFAVIHDTTNHEPPDFYTSYNRSLDTMEKYKEQYPSIDVFIDVHRDADESEGENKDYVEIDGKRVARLMFVVGTGQGVTGVGWEERPHWQQNYQLALDITDELNKICPTLGKPVRVKTGRYNQHMSSRAMLIEVGHNKNTLEEAMNAMPYFAKALAAATRD